MTKTASPATPAADELPKPTVAESIRETVDSIVIAFILAFLFRTFEAEAFVIPTGSMALTLMGDHKDLSCSQCGYPYKASASSESPNNDQETDAFQGDEKNWRFGNTVTSSVCPNCRYRMKYDPTVTKQPAPPSYKGDRILVTKYSYEFSDPARWDVAVFKNPSQAKINYIKRVVGLPHEEVLIYRGDIYIRGPQETKFRMARKPAAKAEAMAQIVYDQDYALPQLHQRGWPERWVSEMSGATPRWQQSSDLKSFRVEDRKADEAWLRYQHFVPTSQDWATLEQQALDPQQRARLKPQLITDFCEYNTNRERQSGDDISYLGLHWVGDLAVDCELEFLEPRDPAGEAVLEIVEGGRAYQCRINVASGDAVLSIAGLDGYAPKAAAALTGAGPHKIRFANVDDQLLLWVDGNPIAFDASTHFQSADKIAADPRDAAAGELIEFDGDTKFAPLNNLLPTRQDVASPIGIAAKNAGLTVTHLKILRDAYYVADLNPLAVRKGWSYPENSMVTDYRTNVFAGFAQERLKTSLSPALAGRPLWSEALLADFMSDVDLWPERFNEAGHVQFKLDADQFFVLGDNSPRSLDGRLWNPSETYVKRELLIGKALFVYWPHGWETLPWTNIHVPHLPLIGGNYVPDFSRMRLIR